MTSHLRLAADAATLGPASRVGSGTADCYLAFDMLVGSDARNLGYAAPERTLVVSTSPVPTGSMVRDASVAAPDVAALVERIAATSREVVRLDAQAAAQALFRRRCRRTCWSSAPPIRRGRCRSRPRRSSGRSS